MQKIPFEDLPSTNTPINATNLNAIQDNAETAINGVHDEVENIGEVYYMFGDIMGDDGNNGVKCFSRVVATKHNISGVWKLECEGRFERNSSVTSNYFYWGYSISKLINLFNNASGKTLYYDGNLRFLSTWYSVQPTNAWREDRMNYGSCFEVVNLTNTYLAPARIYTTTGSTGGWPIDAFTTSTVFKATIYLREQGY